MAVVPLAVSYTYRYNNKEKCRYVFEYIQSVYTCEFVSRSFNITAKGSVYINYIIICMDNVTRSRN